MNHGTCDEDVLNKNQHTVNGTFHKCGKPAKFRCSSPLDIMSKLTCGTHKRYYDSHGWIITDLEREAKMKAEANE